MVLRESTAPAARVIDLRTLVLVGAVALFGGVAQGGMGFGFGAVAAPLLALLDPSFVPVPVPDRDTPDHHARGVVGAPGHPRT